MSPEEIAAAWRLGWILGIAVVAVVAFLLIAILLVARKIESLAGSALEVAGTIESRTRPIWLLGDANRLVAGILASATRIEEAATSAAGALERGGGSAR